MNITNIIFIFFVLFLIINIYFFIKNNYKENFDSNNNLFLNKNDKNINIGKKIIIENDEFSSLYQDNDDIKPLKIAIITSIFGDYDTLKEQNINNRNLVDWYCFTDGKNINNTNNKWNIITKSYYLNELKEYFIKLKKTNLKHYNMMRAKYYKLNAHKIDFLQKYDYYIWIDGSINLQNNFINNIYKIINKNNNDVIHFKHSERNNIKDEYLLSKQMNKYKIINLDKQYNDYINEGFRDNIGLYENTIIIRKNNTKINDVFNKWFDEIIKYGFQDQISLPFIYWKYNIKPYLIKENVFNNKLYSFLDYSQYTKH